MSGSAILTIKILTDASNASRGLSDASSQVAQWEQKTRKAALVASAAFATVAVAVGVSVDAASRQQQAFSAVEAVFKSGAPAMQEWAKAQTKIGLSAADAGQSAAYLGAMLKNAGYAEGEAITQSQKLITLAHDMAATFGGSTKDAVDALGSSLRGESDPMERYGVAILQSDITARIAEKGLTGLTGAALKNAQAAARLEIIWEKTSDAQGNAAKNSSSLAERQRQLKATIENTSAAIGAAFLPMAAAWAGALLAVATAAGDHPKVFAALATAVLAVTGAIVGVNLALKAWLLTTSAVAAATRAYEIVMFNLRAAKWALMTATNASTAAEVRGALATKAQAAAQTSLTTAIVATKNAYRALAIQAQLAAVAGKSAAISMLLNPVGLGILAVVAAVAVLVAAIVILWKKSEAFRKICEDVWSRIQDVVSGVAAIIGPAVTDAFTQINTVIGEVSAALRPMIDQYWPSLRDAVMSAAGSVTTIMAALKPLGELLGPVLTVQLKAFIAILVILAQAVALSFGVMATIITAVATVIASTIRQATFIVTSSWAAIKSVLSSSPVQAATAAFASFAGAISGVFNTIKATISGAWAWISSNIHKITDPVAKSRDAVLGIAEAIETSFGNAFDRINRIFEKIADLVRRGKDILSGPFASMAPPPGSGLLAGIDIGSDYVMAARSQSAPIMVENHYHVEITGALVDPEGSARAISELLARSATRNGGSPLVGSKPW